MQPQTDVLQKNVAHERTDLLSTWLLFHRCHGECFGLFLILAVVFHPGYSQSPYKDRQKWADKLISVLHGQSAPKTEAVYSLLFRALLQTQPSPSPEFQACTATCPLHIRRSKPSLTAFRICSGLLRTTHLATFPMRLLPLHILSYKLNTCNLLLLLSCNVPHLTAAWVLPILSPKCLSFSCLLRSISFRTQAGQRPIADLFFMFYNTFQVQQKFTISPINYLTCSLVSPISDHSFLVHSPVFCYRNIFNYISLCHPSHYKPPMAFPVSPDSSGGLAKPVIIWSHLPFNFVFCKSYVYVLVSLNYFQLPN